MDTTYADHKQEETKALKAEETGYFEGGPSMAALRSGAASPNDGQRGHRVDLPEAMRAKMENAFGADLSALRLYESRAVAEAGAQAVTRGPEIAFAPGMLDFTSFGGQSLLGHEISHVVSQARGEVAGGGFLNDASMEARADREGAMAAAGERVSMPSASLSPVSAADASGPMQAKKDKKAEPNLKPVKTDPLLRYDAVQGMYVPRMATFMRAMNAPLPGPATPGGRAIGVPKADKAVGPAAGDAATADTVVAPTTSPGKEEDAGPGPGGMMLPPGHPRMLAMQAMGLLQRQQMAKGMEMQQLMVRAQQEAMYHQMMRNAMLQQALLHRPMMPPPMMGMFPPFMGMMPPMMGMFPPFMGMMPPMMGMGGPGRPAPGGGAQTPPAPASKEGDTLPPGPGPAPSTPAPPPPEQASLPAGPTTDTPPTTTDETVQTPGPVAETSPPAAAEEEALPPDPGPVPGTPPPGVPEEDEEEKKKKDVT